MNAQQANTTSKPTALQFSSILKDDPLIDSTEVCRLLGRISEPTLYRNIRAGLLPRPLKIGGLSRWRLSWIETYVAAQEAAR